MTHFSSARLSTGYRPHEAESSTSATTSSIHSSRSKRACTVTRLRWLWAPRALISREQGQSVVTGIFTVSMKSSSTPLDALKAQS